MSVESMIDGMERAERGTDPVWKQEARAFIEEYLKHNEFMFTDDLWSLGLPETRENRALGPIINSMKSAGLIENSGTTRARLGKGNCTPGTVWRSLVYVSERRSDCVWN